MKRLLLLVLISSLCMASGKEPVDLAAAEKAARASAEAGSDAYWKNLLLVGEAYYAASKYKDAERIYDEFFKQYPLGPPDDLKKHYMEKAYQYAQMLVLNGEKDKALKAYGMLLRAGPSRHIDRQVRGETVELLVQLAQETKDKEEKAHYIAEVKKHGAKLLWVQDLWFGKGIAALAHVKQMEGDPDGAAKMLNDYMPQVREIDKALSAALGEGLGHLSPLPHCRYVLALVMLEKAESAIAEEGDEASIKLLMAGITKDGKQSAGALQHFVNIAERYPKSAWAADAKKKSAHIQELLKTRYNMKVSVGEK